MKLNLASTEARVTGLAAMRHRITALEQAIEGLNDPVFERNNPKSVYEGLKRRWLLRWSVLVEAYEAAR